MSDEMNASAQAWLAAQKADSAHPERYVLGKPHPNRAKQFKPFAALRGYEELVEEEMRKAKDPLNRKS